jgi:Cu(I)/Ag(I) efflux system protein CusF
MNSTSVFALVLSLALATGCTAANEEAGDTTLDTPVTAARPQASPPGEVDVGNVQKGSATGTITALDPAASKVTIDHGPVPELQWPAMNMGFGATPAQVAQLQVGQRVEFSFEMAGNQATITRVEPLP